MDKVSSELFSLHPVSFRYKKEIDPKGMSQLGLVAEEVEKVNPDLVLHNKEGKPYSVRYDQVNAMLLNEFLKEHREVQELELANAELKCDAARQHAIISDLKKQLDIVLTRLEEQHSKIQAVSDQLKMSKAEPQIASNDH
jgi:hypothetical protein